MNLMFLRKNSETSREKLPLMKSKIIFIKKEISKIVLCSNISKYVEAYRKRSEISNEELKRKMR